MFNIQNQKIIRTCITSKNVTNFRAKKKKMLCYDDDSTDGTLRIKFPSVSRQCMTYTLKENDLKCALKNLPKDRKFHFIKDVIGTLPDEIKELIELTNEVFNINEENLKATIDHIFDKQKTVPIDYFMQLFYHVHGYRPKKLPLLCQLIKEYVTRNSTKSIVFENLHPSLRAFLINQKLFEATRMDRDMPSIETVLNIFEPGSLYDIINRDDISSLQSLISKDPDFDFQQKYSRKSYIPSIPKESEIGECTILDLAAFLGSLKVFNFLLKNGAQITFTTGVCSIYGGNLDIIHVLEKNNFDFNGKLFYYAIISHRNDIADYLIEKYNCYQVTLQACLSSYNQEAFFFEYPFRSSDDNLKRCIFISGSEGDLIMLKYLIDKCKIKIKDINQESNNPLHAAAIFGHPGVLKYLLEEKKFNIEQENIKGLTPLYLACINGQIQTAEYLIKMKGNLEFRNNKGESVLHHACTFYDLPMVKYLVEQCKFNIEDKNKKKRTPLFYACHYQCFKVVEYLLEKGAEINVQDKAGMTPLMVATIENSPQIVKYLLEKGADRNIESKDGITAMECAMDSDNVKLIELLEEEEDSRRSGFGSINDAQKLLFMMRFLQGGFPF